MLLICVVDFIIKYIISQPYLVVYAVDMAKDFEPFLAILSSITPSSSASLNITKF